MGFSRLTDKSSLSLYMVRIIAIRTAGINGLLKSCSSSGGDITTKRKKHHSLAHLFKHLMHHTHEKFFGIFLMSINFPHLKHLNMVFAIKFLATVYTKSPYLTVPVFCYNHISTAFASFRYHY